MERMVDIVAIGAHPDDVEIGIGATLAQEASAGRRVVVVDATAGEAASNGTPGERALEAARAARVLGIARRFTLALPDGRLAAARETLAGRIGSLLGRMRPRLLLLPHPADRHADHRALGEIGRRLASPGLPVAYYRIHSTAPLTHAVAVERGYAAKMEALRCHRSQFVHVAGRTPTVLNRAFLDGIREREEVLGQRVGVPMAEGLILESGDALSGVDPGEEAGMLLPLVSQVVQA